MYAMTNKNYVRWWVWYYHKYTPRLESKLAKIRALTPK